MWYFWAKVVSRSFQGHLTQKLQIKPRDRKQLFVFLNECTYGFVLHKNLHNLELIFNDVTRLTNRKRKNSDWHSIGSLTVTVIDRLSVKRWNRLWTWLLTNLSFQMCAIEFVIFTADLEISKFSKISWIFQFNSRRLKL